MISVRFLSRVLDALDNGGKLSVHRALCYPSPTHLYKHCRSVGNRISNYVVVQDYKTACCMACMHNKDICSYRNEKSISVRIEAYEI